MSSSLVKLSASRIKTLQTCSWLYYASYILKIPDDSNDGAKRGTICHLVFECCLRDRHQHYVKNIIHNYEKKKILPLTIERLVLKNAKKLNVFDDTNLKMIREMIYIGINYDFLCQGSEQLEPEIEFDYNNGKYHIGGFIDKRVKYKDKTVIWDYKTSKEKFDKKEINSSIQNLMYCLASWKESNQIPQLNFLFLRFPSDPVQVAPRPTPEELKGFEYYLENISIFLQDFNEKKACSNFAADSKEKAWLCGFAKKPNQLKKDGTPMWYCKAKFPFEYYVLCNQDGDIIKTSFKEEDLTPLIIDDYFIIKKEYKGCKKFSNYSPKNVLDFF